ncbi:hypothetical protein KCP78_02355 [Salmonella enterica subsp. enterica]|nr:hypothetical protein KCP78_02355 [Salmonella enterica subsp. enterica]
MGWAIPLAPPPVSAHSYPSAEIADRRRFWRRPLSAVLASAAAAAASASFVPPLLSPPFGIRFFAPPLLSPPRHPLLSVRRRRRFASASSPPPLLSPLRLPVSASAALPIRFLRPASLRFPPPRPCFFLRPPPLSPLFGLALLAVAPVFAASALLYFCPKPLNVLSRCFNRSCPAACFAAVSRLLLLQLTPSARLALACAGSC